MRSLGMSVVTAVLLLAICYTGALATNSAQDVAPDAMVLVCSAASADVDSAPVVKPERRSGLDRKARRKLGLTFKNIRRATKALYQAGELEDMSRSEIAAAVLDKITSENPKVYADPTLDWDALLDFIERLIPIILRLIELFAVDIQAGPMVAFHAGLPPPIALAA